MFRNSCIVDSSPSIMDSVSTEQSPTTINYNKYIKYLFIFIGNYSGDKHLKNSNSTYTIDVEYLMNETYEMIDQLQFHISKKNYIELNKKWIDCSRLDNFLKEIKNDSGCSLNTSGDYEMECQNSATPEIIFEQTVQYFFVISSFDNQLYDLLFKHNQRIIGPLTIQYWYRLCMAQSENFNLAHHLTTISRTLFSECMKDTMIYLSKSINTKDLNQLYNRIRWMGGCVTNELDLEVTHAVAEALLVMSDDNSQSISYKSSDMRINAAACFEIPVVNVDWINIAWSHLQLQYMFALNINFVESKLCDQLQLDTKPILKPFIIGIFLSVYHKQTSKSKDPNSKFQSIIHRINNVVVRFGGTLITSPECLNFKKVNLILHLCHHDKSEQQDANNNVDELNQINQNLLKLYERDPYYRQLNERYGDGSIPIVTVNWLFETIINIKVQPYEPYQIKIQSKPNKMMKQMGSIFTENSLENKSPETKKSDEEISAISWLESNRALLDHINKIEKKKKQRNNYFTEKDY